MCRYSMEGKKRFVYCCCWVLFSSLSYYGWFLYCLAESLSGVVGWSTWKFIAVVVCVAVTCALSFITCGGSFIALWTFFFDLFWVLSLSFLHCVFDYCAASWANAFWYIVFRAACVGVPTIFIYVLSLLEGDVLLLFRIWGYSVWRVI